MSSRLYQLLNTDAVALVDRLLKDSDGVLEQVYLRPYREVVANLLVEPGDSSFSTTGVAEVLRGKELTEAVKVFLKRLAGQLSPVFES